MRRFVPSLVLLAACSASGSDDQTHGPVFDVDAAPHADAGRDASDATAPPHDATTGDDAPSEAAGDDDGSIDARGDDAGDAATPIDASDAGDAGDAGSCTALTAVLGGGASVFGAIASGRGAFAAQTIAGSLASAPALVASGATFQGLARENGNALAATSFASSTWTALAALAGNPLANDAPAIAPVGADLRAVYLGTNHLYYAGTFHAGAWDAANEPVDPFADAATQAFGPVRASAAGAGAELVIAYQGNDNHLYAQSWTASGWQAATMIGADLLAANEPPALVALDGGATDLVVVYESRADTKLYSFARAAAGKAWSGPTLVNVNAFTADAPTLAPMPGGRAIVAWRGTDGHPYTSAYTASSTSWSAPLALVAGSNPTVAAAPSLAPGNCGDDALAAYVAGGAVSVTRYASGAWGAPAAIPNVTGATYATIAAAP